MDTSSVRITNIISDGELTLTATVEGKPHCVFTDDICEKKTQIQTKAFDFNSKIFSCVTCNKQFRSKQNLKTHMNTLDGIKTHMQIHDGLKTHMKRHDDLKLNICDICNKSFMGKSDLKKHMRIHSGENLTAVMFVEEHLVLQVIYLVI